MCQKKERGEHKIHFEYRPLGKNEVECQHCGGTGLESENQICHVCGGFGKFQIEVVKRSKMS